MMQLPKHTSWSKASLHTSPKFSVATSFLPTSLHTQRARHVTIRCMADQHPKVATQAAKVDVIPGQESAVVTDSSVPEGHKGLHGALYGEFGADAHETEHRYEFIQGEDDGMSLLDVDAYLTSRDNEKPVGVYALYNSQRVMEYVGYSRNIVLSLKAHRSRVGEDRTAFVRVMVFNNAAMATRAALSAESQRWLDEQGTLPLGNGVEKDLWEGNRVDTSVMSDAERAEYEEKKTKMQLAMGEKLNDEGLDEDAKVRRDKLRMATEAGNWSEVIDGQTRETIDEPAPESTAAASAASTSGTVVSPFTRADVHRTIGDHQEGPSGAPQGTPAAPREMNVQNVDKVLEEVRPYLMADGGNVRVADVQGGTVLLELEGACGTCPSSSATMKMGIERSLRAAFGDTLKEVVQINAQIEGTTVEAVDQHLDLLRGAISSMGGSVLVITVGNGKVELDYKGPAPIGTGIKAAVRDKFPDVREVVFVE